MSKIQYYDHVHLRSMTDSGGPDDFELQIQIVPAHEADAAEGRISVEAPVGRAVLHRRTGESITVHAHGRLIPMRIMAVEKRVIPA